MLLIINSGSSSIKYKIFDKNAKKLLKKGMVSRIGMKGSNVPDHDAAIKIILKNLPKISLIGHRVVHGGEAFTGSAIITKKVIKAVERFSKLAPLHNAPNLLGIKACIKFLPHITQVAVFDTAYYQSLPKAHYLYAIPHHFYKKDRIRRYGFHGTSHKYVAIKAAKALKKPIARLKIITCHLGNGCSITATMNGKAFDTSMGFTPLEGLIMGTRSGDIDPAIIFYLIEKKKMKPDSVYDILNKKSGLKGISGISSDMRDIYKAVKRGHKKAKLAFLMFVHRIHKYIGAFAASMNGVDAIVFTGGIGENHAPTRNAVCKSLGFLKARTLVIPTDEELMIARETIGAVNL